MKMIIAIVPEFQLDNILQALVAAQYRTTLVSTTGGFLRQGNATLLIGVESESLDQALACIERTMTGPTGTTEQNVNATIFVLDVENHIRI